MPVRTMQPTDAPGLAPIVVTLEIAAPPAQCYQRFTAGFGDWWPVRTHSLSRDAATRCVLEARIGGRVLETAPDGTEHLWGNVTAAEPGRTVRFTWHPGREAGSAQWVEVLFEAAPTGCQATLTHAGWESLGEIGPLLRQQYASGWRHLFGELFARYASTTR